MRRTNEQARAGVLMTAEQARHYIAECERAGTDKRAMRTLGAAIVAGRGNLTAEARQVWREYLNRLSA